MKTVLVAIDGSPAALKGVAFAAPIAKALGAAIELVYVSFPTLLAPTSYPEAIARLEESEAAAAAKFFAAGKDIVTAHGVEVRTTRVTGSAAEALADLAERPDVWGVAIGAIGHNAVSRVLLGSVSDRLTHICPKPVLVVR